jgi:hypothetical protein
MIDHARRIVEALSAIRDAERELHLIRWEGRGELHNEIQAQRDRAYQQLEDALAAFVDERLAQAGEKP